MYAMCNGGKIPFESDSCDRKNACEERFSGKAVTAPSEGDEKLKSVIVIACQPNNANRWKNAGNIKNALTSIKTEIGTSSPVPNPDVVVPENTVLTEMYLKNMIMMNLRIQSRLNRRIILTIRMRFRQLRTLFLIMNLKAANSLALPKF